MGKGAWPKTEDTIDIAISKLYDPVEQGSGIVSRRFKVMTVVPVTFLFVRSLKPL